MVFGDCRITDVIQAHSEEITSKEAWFRQEDQASSKTLVLPRLPKPWMELNAPTTHAILVGVIKDLGLGWSEKDRPLWWAKDVDYRHPKKSGNDVPKGKLTNNTLYLTGIFVLNCLCSCRKMATNVARSH